MLSSFPVTTYCGLLAVQYILSADTLYFLLRLHRKLAETVATHHVKLVLFTVCKLATL